MTEKISLMNRQYSKIGNAVRKNWDLYLLMFIPFTYIVIFCYIPMYGAQIAFKDYQAVRSIFDSPWVGLLHFKTFFKSYMFVRLLKNTVGISLYGLAAGFPIPIILALMLNYLKFIKYKKFIQTITYAPHFISTVVMCGMILQFLAVRNGIVNNIIEAVGFERVEFLSDPSLFWSVFVWSGVWQSTGFSSIIYISALSGVDPQLHEAAIVDGANILRRIWNIDLPSIQPTILILLILSCGSVINVGFEKVYLLQNSLNASTSEVISTYVYKIGLGDSLGNFSYSAAIGLFQSVVNLILLLTVNFTARKVSGISLW